MMNELVWGPIIAWYLFLAGLGPEPSPPRRFCVGATPKRCICAGQGCWSHRSPSGWASCF